MSWEERTLCAALQAAPFIGFGPLLLVARNEKAPHYDGNSIGDALIRDVNGENGTNSRRPERYGRGVIAGK